MRTSASVYVGSIAIALAVALGVLAPATSARQAAIAAVPIDADDIGGVVTGLRGPEAGV
jgi:hypothetical protein